MSRTVKSIKHLRRQINLELSKLKTSKRVRISDYPKLIKSEKIVNLANGQTVLRETHENEDGTKITINKPVRGS